MLKALKILVVGMGILLVVGIGLLGYGLYAKSNTVLVSAGQSPATQGSAAPEFPPSRGFGMLFLDEPEGTTIRSMQISGDTLVLELVGGPQVRPNRLTIVDIKSGAVLGRINLGSAL